jgi:hypothetical protein
MHIKQEAGFEEFLANRLSHLSLKKGEGIA